MLTETLESVVTTKGISYAQYLDEWDKYLAETDLSELSETETRSYEFRKLNRQRSSRVHKTYSPSNDLIDTLAELNRKQVWIVLTESWCGDSAQLLPYLAMIADQSDDIEFQILRRDENLDIMDQYLTDGKSRSIPKLVAFDENGEELFQWGPRPNEVQNFVKSELAKGRDKQDVLKDLHIWYARDRGKSIENEITNLIKTTQ